MPINVECDVCGKRYRMNDRHAERVLPCKDCLGACDFCGVYLRHYPRQWIGPLGLNRCYSIKNATSKLTRRVSMFCPT